MSERIRFEKWWLVVFLLIVADAGTTVVGMETGLNEQNPIVQDWIQEEGLAIAILWSVSIRFLLTGVLVLVQEVVLPELLNDREEWLEAAPLAAVLFLHVAVVTNNVLQLAI